MEKIYILYNDHTYAINICILYAALDPAKHPLHHTYTQLPCYWHKKSGTFIGCVHACNAFPASPFTAHVLFL